MLKFSNWPLCVPSCAVCSHRCAHTVRFNVPIMKAYSAFLSHKTSAACLCWGACRAERMDSSLNAYEMLRVTLYQFLDSCNYSRVIIPYNYFSLSTSEQVAKLLCSEQSRSTGGLPVNKRIHFNRWVIRYCGWQNSNTKNDELNDPHVVIFNFLGWNWSRAT